MPRLDTDQSLAYKINEAYALAYDEQEETLMQTCIDTMYQVFEHFLAIRDSRVLCIRMSNMFAPCLAKSFFT